MEKNNKLSQSRKTLRRRSYLLGVVGVATLSGCVGEGDDGGAEAEAEADEDAEPEDIVGGWYSDNMGDINGAFDELYEGEDHFEGGRELAALTHFQRAFETFGGLKETADNRESDANDADETELWSVSRDYFFNLEEGVAHRYLAMSELDDGNDYEAETLYAQSYPYLEEANGYADQLNDQLSGALDGSIPQY